ncbi:hypothetical protein SLE2022_346530 [Rubroshorea leprosula]
MLDQRSKLSNLRFLILWQACKFMTKDQQEKVRAQVLRSQGSENWGDLTLILKRMLLLALRRHKEISGTTGRQIKIESSCFNMWNGWDGQDHPGKKDLPSAGDKEQFRL